VPEGAEIVEAGGVHARRERARDGKSVEAEKRARQGQRLRRR